MTKIDANMIIEINELYKEIGTYAGVARKLGISGTTVKKYVQTDYVAFADRSFIRADIGECRKIIENFRLNKEDMKEPSFLILTEEEREEIKELWKELSV